MLTTVTTAIQQSIVTQKFNFTGYIYDTFMHAFKNKTQYPVKVCLKLLLLAENTNYA